MDEICIMRECQWLIARKYLDLNFGTEKKLSKFLNRKSVEPAEIIEAIEENSFFGLVKVKISTPSEVIEKYKSLNFGFIFNKKTVTRQMVNPKMLQMADEAGRKFPCEVMTLTFEADERIIITPLLKFYTKLGMKIERIYWAIQYNEDRPL